MRANLNTYKSQPHILACNPENDCATETSLTHHPVIKSIFLIRRHLEDRSKTLVQIYDDKKPFDKRQKIILNYRIYHAVLSLDRRSAEEQEANRFVVAVLVKSDNSHKLVKLTFSGTTCKPEDIIFSKVVQDELRICDTMRDNLVVTFYPNHAQLYDGDLIYKNKTVWLDVLRVS